MFILFLAIALAPDFAAGQADAPVLLRFVPTTGLRGEAFTLLRNIGSPYGYGTNGVKNKFDAALLKTSVNSDHREVAALAQSAVDLQANYLRSAERRADLANASREAGNQLRWGLIKGLFSDDTLGSAAQTTSDAVRPMQQAVIPMLQNQIEANAICARMVSQAKTLAQELHSRVPSRTNIIQAWFDKQVGSYGFVDVKNSSGRALTNCVLVARAVMNEDYVRRSIQAPAELSFVLDLMGISPDTSANARQVENLTVKIRSSPQGMFVYVPYWEPNVRVRFKACDPAGMHFAMNFFIQAWSDDVASEELSLQQDLMTVRARLNQQQQEQTRIRQQQMQREQYIRQQQRPTRFSPFAPRR